MTLGSRLGARLGSRLGARNGGAKGSSGSSVSLTTDATSGKGVPLTQAEWNAVFDAAGVARKTVSHAWGFQDAAGDAVAAVGTNLTVVGASYQQPVAGWTRKAISWGDAANARAVHASGVGANPATASALWIGYIDLTAVPALPRFVLSPSFGAPSWNGGLTSASVLRTLINGVPTVGASDAVAGGVRPVAVLHDITGSRARLYSDQEKISGTYAAVADGVKGFGSTGASAAAMATLWGACFAGASAEWSDADMKAVLTALSWTIPWS